MTRYAATQLLLAFVLAAAGAIKATRIVIDAIDDAVTLPAGS